MENNGHITRTLSVHENYILVSAGSEGNLDPKATEFDLGYSVIKFFDLKETQVRTPQKAQGWAGADYWPPHRGDLERRE